MPHQGEVQWGELPTKHALPLERSQGDAQSPTRSIDTPPARIIPQGASGDATGDGGAERIKHAGYAGKDNRSAYSRKSRKTRCLFRSSLRRAINIRRIGH